MSKTLILLRHGKSDWGAENEHDHERPLAKRGVQGARRMGAFIPRALGEPERVLSSSAERARRTAELAAQAGDWKAAVETTSALYEATVEDILRLVSEQGRDGVDRWLLCGHEPAWSETAGRLVGGARIRIPTAAVVSIRFDVRSWSEVAPGRGELRALVTPKQIKRLGAKSD